MAALIKSVGLALLLLLALGASTRGASVDAFRQQQPPLAKAWKPSQQQQQQQQQQLSKTTPLSSPQQVAPALVVPVGRRGGAGRGAIDRKEEEPAPVLGVVVARPAVAGALVLAVATTAFLVLFGDGVEVAWGVAGGAAGARASAIDAAAILQKAGKKAIGGGASGAAASLVQLVTLGWLRTSMNYQVLRMDARDGHGDG